MIGLSILSELAVRLLAEEAGELELTKLQLEELEKGN
jgi:hypothetical protein